MATYIRRHDDDSNSSASISDIEKAYIPNDEGSIAGQEPQIHGATQESTVSQWNDTKIERPPSSLINWDGPDDPDNPHNWSMASRLYHATVPGLFGFAV